MSLFALRCPYIGIWLLVQLRILGFGLLVDRGIGVGILPERQEILIRRFGFRSVPLYHVSPCETEVRQRSRRVDEKVSAILNDLLKLGSGFRSAMQQQIGLSTRVSNIQIPKFRRRRALQELDCQRWGCSAARQWRLEPGAGHGSSVACLSDSLGLVDRQVSPHRARLPNARRPRLVCATGLCLLSAAALQRPRAE